MQVASNETICFLKTKWMRTMWVFIHESNSHLYRTTLGLMAWFKFNFSRFVVLSRNELHYRISMHENDVSYHSGTSYVEFLVNSGLLTRYKFVSSRFVELHWIIRNETHYAFRPLIVETWLQTVDHLAHRSMKNAASCVNRCKLQNTPNHWHSNAHCTFRIFLNVYLSECRKNI